MSDLINGMCCRLCCVPGSLTAALPGLHFVKAHGRAGRCALPTSCFPSMHVEGQGGHIAAYRQKITIIEINQFDYSGPD